ncbi:MAG: cytochrome c3 family protein [Rhodospirillales bacterium]|nr:cytochrome c3 family protein [Rhodospirillales bacterium]MDH3790680.1 cytochrome c3 family protein [Rhodospirillales bacterium]MDH3910261.1 cytochrome c3 family protein [Rhodospirillales bacterium]MDH3916690.1 cytochrome c3 family protein [Rhodospirillales bacterium]MDH3966292.1 cytochrome c3 family protein [Rhodospirillales bacterium]
MTVDLKSLFATLFSGALALWAGDLAAEGIVGSKHNLSVTGPGPIKSTVEEEICIFCHAPHRARRDVPYLWNRPDSTVNYTTYDSSTLFATPGQPTGGAKLCLSCHDGTVALGAVLTRPAEIPFAGGIRFIPEGPSLLGADLSDDHPISFVYDDSLAAINGELASPSTLTGPVKLDSDGLLQCTACHDPHDDTNAKFLVDPNQFSTLCTTCHLRLDWDISTHAQSAATWNGTPPDPWPHSEFSTVGENGCENCHSPHNAGGHAGLLNYLVEEDNCLTCHNGNVAFSDIESELLKTEAHRVQDFVGIHDPTEDFTTLVTNHVECVDCHNSHRVNGLPASPPRVPGALAGVKGITVSGTQVEEASFSYEVCFKCHADNNVLSFLEISRQILQVNTRFEFDIANPSYHPVEIIGRNPNVPSLLSPYTVNSVIYCTDCHNSDDSPAVGGVGPSGPHGSSYRFLLERNYTTTDFTTESSFAYDLCYKCHDRTSILGNESFTAHDSHITGQQTPCSACHDPHGISSMQGTELNNTHLINFDINIVQPNGAGELRFEDKGILTGECYLTCHGAEHAPGLAAFDYP